MSEAEKLAEAAKALRDDMVMRAKMHSWKRDGEIVVEASNGVWMRFNQALREYEERKQ